MVRVIDFDPSAFLDNDEVVTEYLTAALEDDNPDVFLAAVGHVAKSRGITDARASMTRIRPWARLRGFALMVISTS